jgi:exonuclease III/ribonuclease HI
MTALHQGEPSTSSSNQAHYGFHDDRDDDIDELELKGALGRTGRNTKKRITPFTISRATGSGSDGWAITGGRDTDSESGDSDSNSDGSGVGDATDPVDLASSTSLNWYSNSGPDSNLMSFADNELLAADLPDREHGLRVATLNVDQGLRAKLLPMLQWATLAGVHVLALQETGDYAKDHSLLRHLGWHMILSGGAKAGVALLIRQDLNIRIIKEFDSGDGRLVGAMLQSPSGVKTIFISAYLPTALDWAPDEGAKADAARTIYSTILTWAASSTRGAGLRTVVLGDLNETLTAADRQSPSLSSQAAVPTSSRHPARRPRFITALTTAGGYVDTYRLLHCTHGFTCVTKLGQQKEHVARSRIDYVLTHGFNSALVSATSNAGSASGGQGPAAAADTAGPANQHHVIAARVLDPPAKLKTRHRVLVVDLRLQIAAPEHSPPPRPPMPDMRHASREEKDAMMVVMEVWANNNDEWILRMSTGNKENIAELGRAILEAAWRATRQLPSTGGLRGRSKRRCALSLRRRNLCSLRHLLNRFVENHGGVIPWSSRREVYLRVTRCRDDVNPSLWGSLDVAAVACGDYDLRLWLHNVQKQINFVRREQRRFDAALDGYVGDDWTHNPTAFVHRMQDGDQAPEVNAVIDPTTGLLVTDPAEVGRVFRDHYMRTFACRDRDDEKRPPWITDLYANPKAGINPDWYVGLMNPISNDDVKAALSSAKFISAPGEDRISSGIWRVMVRSPVVCSVIGSLLSGCLIHRFQPAAAKHAIIVPIVKKKNGAKTLDNFRAISLQCSLFKILSKVLATRLGAILAAHPILHRAQDGFLPGGDPKASPALFLDLIEDAHEYGRALFAILYDFRGAYDSVRHDDVLLACRRLSIPEAFIEFIADSVMDLMSCVRTAHGCGDLFAVMRSIKQGDPLAPLLFIIFLDALHCVLHANPIHPGLPNDGYQMRGIAAAGHRVASMGYADDTTTISDTWLGLCRLHVLMCVFAVWHQLELHATKSQLVGFAAGGLPFTNTDICLDGTLLLPVPIYKGFNHLGITIQMDLGWSSQVAVIGSMIGLFCHGLERHRCPLHIAVSIVNEFLISKIAHRLHFVAPTAAQARKWDIRICRTLSNMCGRRGARAIKTSIWVVVCGLLLPSSYEKMLKISETFLRLNGDPSRAWSAQARWSAISSNRSGTKNRLVRAIKLTHELGWSMTTIHRGARWWPVAALVPSGRARMVAISALLSGQKNNNLFVTDHHGMWGEQQLQWPTVHMYTDGSWHAPKAGRQGVEAGAGVGTGVSSWSVCIRNEWLSTHFLEVEGEGQISDRTRSQVSVFGGRIDVSVGEGNFDAELTAIARGLMCIPIACSCIIHTDSQSSIQSINSYRLSAVHKYRWRLRMAGRPLLALVDKVMKAKEAAGGVVDLRWIKAHTDVKTIDHVGNRLADDYATRVCDEKQLVRHRVTSALPLHLHEPFVVLRVGVTGDEKRGSHGAQAESDGRVLTGDPRRAVWRSMVKRAAAAWAVSPSQSLYSDNDDVDSIGLWRFAVQHMPAACGFVMLALSNAWQWRRPRTDGRQKLGAAVAEEKKNSVAVQLCGQCDGSPVLDVGHLTVCMKPVIKQMRERAVNDISAVLDRVAMEGRPGPTWNDNSLMLVGDERPLRAMVAVFGFLNDDHGGRVQLSTAMVTAACIGAFRSDRVMRWLRRDWGIDDEQRRHAIICDLRRPLLAWAFSAAEATKNL